MQGIASRLLAMIVEHWGTLVFVVILAYLARNRYGRGLNKYPGPFLASITDWWRFYDVYKRRPDQTHRRLHGKHGDVVRLGPNTLSFSDPKALKTIYGLNKGFVKVRRVVCASPKLTLLLKPCHWYQCCTKPATNYSSPSF